MSKKAIFIIEDSKDIRDLIRIVYAREGYETDFAADGKEALEKLRARQNPPGVILLDLSMTGMDGAAFRAEQGKDPRIASIPVLLMTGDASAESKVASVGAQGVIKKPVELDTFLKVAAKFCS